jgi:hypothetical protein
MTGSLRFDFVLLQRASNSALDGALDNIEVTFSQPLAGLEQFEKLVGMRRHAIIDKDGETRLY